MKKAKKTAQKTRFTLYLDPVHTDTLQQEAEKIDLRRGVFLRMLIIKALDSMTMIGQPLRK